MFKKPQHIAITCVLIANFCFAINFSLVKMLTNSTPNLKAFIGPYALNVIRVGVATILFWLLYLYTPHKEKILKAHYGRFFACAICGVVLNQTLFIGGLVLTSTIHAAILILGTPIFITLITIIFYKEKVTLIKIIGFIIALSAAVLLALQKENVHIGSNILVGDVLVLLNAIAYAMYFVIAKPLMAHYKPLTVIRTIFTLACPIMLAIGFNQIQLLNFGIWQWQHFVALSGIVLGATFIAYLCNAIALQTIGAARTGAFIYTQPVIATIIAVLFLGDTLTWQKLIAAILIVGGVVLINKK